MWTSLGGPSIDYYHPRVLYCEANAESIVLRASSLHPRTPSSTRPSNGNHLPHPFDSLIWSLSCQELRSPTYDLKSYLRIWFSDLESVGSLSRCLPTGWSGAIIIQCSRNWLPLPRKKILHPDELVSTMPCPASSIWYQQLPESYLSFQSVPSRAPKRLSLATVGGRAWRITGCKVAVTYARCKSGPVSPAVGNTVNVFHKITFCNL